MNKKKIIIILISTIVSICIICAIVFSLKKDDATEKFSTLVYQSPYEKGNIYETIKDKDSIKILSNKVYIDEENREFLYISYKSNEEEKNGYIQKVNDEKIKLKKGEKFKFKNKKIVVLEDKKYKLPFATNVKNIKWSSSDLNIVKINKDGNIVTKKEGIAQIIAEDSSGKLLAMCEVQVTKKEITSLYLDRRKVYLNIGENVQLGLIVEPMSLGNEFFNWKSSDDKIVTVTKNGKITAKKEGTTKVIVSSKDNKFKDVVEVIVTDKANENLIKSIDVTTKSLKMILGEKLLLEYTVNPINSIEEVIITSDNKEIVNVDSYGILTALGEGTANITISNTSNTIKSVCKVTVERIKVTGIKLDTENAEIELNGLKSYQFATMISPYNASNQNIIWISSDTAVATVDKAGNVVGQTEGITRITAITEDGNKTAQALVLVTTRVRDIKLNTENIDLQTNENKSFYIETTISPKNATDKNVLWSSSDSNVATVDQNGEVTAVSNGIAKITATTVDGNLSASATVKVTTSVSDIQIDQNEILLNVNGNNRKVMTATLLPKNATPINIEWSSSDENIATVNKNGEITAVSNGIADIIAKANNKTALVKVTVRTLVEDIIVNNKDIQLESNGNNVTKLDVKVLPEDEVSDNELLFSSNNPLVATVDNNGKITAIQRGTAEITISSKDNAKKTKVNVNVITKVESIQIPEKMIYLEIGESTAESKYIKAEITPSDATNQNIQWTSSNEDVAIVDNNGNVSPIKSGTSIIMATTEDGSKTASVLVIVETEATNISLNKSELQLETNTDNNSEVLIANIEPETASYREISWQSSNPLVATVDTTGKVSAVSKGIAEITATTYNGRKTATTVVNVITRVKKVELDQKNISLNLKTNNDKAQLVATITPSIANNKNVVWASSDNSIATVDSNGLVTAVGNGEAIITATTEDGGLTASTNVSVNTKVESISINEKNISLKTNGTIEEKEKKLEVSILPLDANNTDLIWSSSNSSVATVDSNGKVVARNNGTAIISAMTKDGSVVSDTVVVNVSTMLKNIEILNNNIELQTNGTKSAYLNIKISPSNASNQRFSITSSNEDVVKVENNKIIAKSLGNAIITVTTEESNMVATATVTVTECENVVNVRSIKINDRNVSLITNEKANNSMLLNYTIDPNNASNKSVTWTSSNENIVRVDEFGKITAVGNGEATITVTTEDGNKSHSINVQSSTKITDINVNTQLLNLEVNEKYQIISSANPIDSSNPEVHWSSNNLVVATVDQTGLITAKSNGTAIISVISNFDNNIRKEIEVKVETSVDRISLDKTNISLKMGEEETSKITATIEPSIASNKTITWESSNMFVATVNDLGEVTAVGVGETTITATTNNGKEATATVTVTSANILVSSISLDKEHLDLVTNGTRESYIKATISPSNASNKELIWRSNNTSVATVDSSGKVTAVKAGTAIIEVKSKDERISSTVTVKVTTAVTGVNLNLSALSLQTNGTRQGTLTATVSPSDASNKELIWSSNNTSVATVDSNGIVTAQRDGTATIMVTTRDGGKTASLPVTVTTAVTEIKLNLSALSLQTNGTRQGTLIATISPSNATNKTITWTSSNSSVATVNSSGQVTALKSGTTIITAKTNNGKEAKATVTVTTNVTGISLNVSSATLMMNDSTKQTTISATISPSGADDKTITWTSSDSTVATVDSSGKVTALKPGTTTITATTNNSKKTATTKITVKKRVVIIIGASQVSRMAGSGSGGDYSSYKVSSWSSRRYTYSTSNASLVYIHSSGSGIEWQYNSSKGGKLLTDELNKYSNAKSYVEFFIFYPLSGNTIKTFCCNCEDNLKISSDNDTIKGYVRGYNSAVQGFKNSNYNVKAYVVSMHPVKPNQAAAGSNVVSNSNSAYCTKDYRSNWKYYNFNRSVKHIIENNNTYSNNLTYLPLFVQIMDVTGSTSTNRTYSYKKIYNIDNSKLIDYSTDDGIHWNSVTTGGYVNLMLSYPGSL